jgi:hypothetical protein
VELSSEITRSASRRGAHFDFELANREPLYLSCWRCRKAVNETNVVGNFETCDLSAAELLHIFCIDVRPRPHSDPRCQYFAEPIIAEAENARLIDIGMALQVLLNLAGVDVLAAADNDVLEAPDDANAAVWTHCRQIASMQLPFGIDCVRGRFRLVIVAAHDEISARADLSDFVRFDRTPLHIDDSYFGCGKRAPGRFDPHSLRLVGCGHGEQIHR